MRTTARSDKPSHGVRIIDAWECITVVIRLRRGWPRKISDCDRTRYYSGMRINADDSHWDPIFWSQVRVS